MDGPPAASSSLRVEHAAPVTSGSWAAAVVICVALFTDVNVPGFGSSTRLAMLAAAVLLAFSHSGLTCRRTWLAIAFLPGYYALPALVDSSARFTEWDPLMAIGFGLVAVLAARELQSEVGWQHLIDLTVLSAGISGLVALGQRQGNLPPLAIDLWGRATAADGTLRGAGFLPDPNFLAVLLAAAVPLAFSWRRARLRPIALLAIAAGLYATDSRTGMLLAIGVLGISIVLQRQSWGDVSRRRGRLLVQLAAALLVVSFAVNVGGQRDRLVGGLQTALSGDSSSSVSLDSAANVSAQDRREFAIAWFRLGWERFPFGAGVDAVQSISTESGKHNAAHNNFAQAFAQGGAFGVGIIVLTISSLLLFVRRRAEPFALFGGVIVLGGLFLSYPASVLFLFPIGLADGIARGATDQTPSPTDFIARRHR